MESAPDGGAQPQRDGFWATNTSDDRIWLLGVVLAVFPVPILLGKLPFSISEARSEELTIDAARTAVHAASKDSQPPTTNPTSAADAWDLAWHQHQSQPSNTAMATRIQEIDFSTLRFVRPIGQGSFGSVFLATWQETTVAVKVMSTVASAAIATSIGVASTLPPTSPSIALDGGRNAPQHTHTSPTKLLRREAQLLSSLRHPNILLLMSYCTTPPCMVTEYCASGSLLDVLSLARRQATFAAQLTWGRRLGMALDAAKGMLYLHGMGVCHRDLKSDNLMVDSHWRVKVADFNLAALLGQSEDGGGPAGAIHAVRVPAGLDAGDWGNMPPPGGAGSGGEGAANPRWLAPEVLSGGGYSAAADVYGYALVLWELMTWALPWAGANPLQIVLSVVDRKQRPEVPPPGAVQGGPPLQYQQYVDLMQQCWAQDPAARPSFDTVIRRVRGLLAAEGGPG